MEGIQPRREFDAFKAFFATFKLSQPVDTPADLSDGVVLYDFLAAVSAPPHRSVLTLAS